MTGSQIKPHCLVPRISLHIHTPFHLLKDNRMPAPQALPKDSVHTVTNSSLNGDLQQPHAYLAFLFVSLDIAIFERILPC